MKTIYKYNLEAKNTTTASLPKGAEILSFNYQNRNDELFIWALVDVKAPIETRKFAIIGTGHPIDPEMNLKYIGAVHNFRGVFVFHLFEVL